ncbi:MAG: helix-turn-helix transcriptional regulator [Oscillospiraceae bacterium]|nr:helix-turn-helix transcriptional regulator [Oscillospiraceae bacterium]
MPELRTRIREFRARTGMTQGELADRVNVRRETIIRLERGLYNPSLKLAMDIAAVFETTVETLFSFSGEEAGK